MRPIRANKTETLNLRTPHLNKTPGIRQRCIGLEPLS